MKTHVAHPKANKPHKQPTVKEASDPQLLAKSLEQNEPQPLTPSQQLSYTERMARLQAALQQIHQKKNRLRK